MPAGAVRARGRGFASARCVEPERPVEVSRRRASRTYLALGALLGLGAPAGLLVLERTLLGRHPRVRAVIGLASGYLAVATPLVFGLFGMLLGEREEKVRASAEQVERLREEFAAVVAHDLRTPTQAILLQVGSLLRQARDGQVMVPVATLERMQRSGELLAHMVRDLLDTERIETERLSLSLRTVSLPDAVTALVDRIRPTLGAHPVRVSVDPGAAPVRADPVRLDQILTNLLENAAKYSDEGQPIEVRVGPAGSGALVSVTDHGPGIPPDEQRRLFDRYYQARRAREKKTGLGLGLYIAKGLVDAHGGRIEVRSQPGRGSTFSVWLPAAQPRANGPAARSA